MHRNQLVSKIDRPSIDLPVTEARWISAAATAEFLGHLGFAGRLAALFGFFQSALGCRGKRLLSYTLFRRRFAVVVVCVLHLFHHWMVY